MQKQYSKRGGRKPQLAGRVECKFLLYMYILTAQTRKKITYTLVPKRGRELQVKQKFPQQMEILIEGGRGNK